MDVQGDDCLHEHVRQMHDATTYLCEDCGVEGYRTKTGRILTNEDIEALADEAAYGDMAERYGPDEG